MSLQSDSGEVHVLGSSEIEFVIAGHKFSHNLYVVSGLNRNCIWENDWMDKNGVRIYFFILKSSELVMSTCPISKTFTFRLW